MRELLRGHGSLATRTSNCLSAQALQRSAHPGRSSQASTRHRVRESARRRPLGRWRGGTTDGGAAQPGTGGRQTEAGIRGQMAVKTTATARAVLYPSAAVRPAGRHLGNNESSTVLYLVITGEVLSLDVGCLEARCSCRLRREISMPLVKNAYASCHGECARRGVKVCA